MKIRWISLVVLLALVLTGCGASPTNVAESSDLPLTDPTKIPLSTLIPAQPTQGDKTQMNPFLPVPSAPGLEGLIETAKEDLAKRFPKDRAAYTANKGTYVGEVLRKARGEKMRK